MVQYLDCMHRGNATALVDLIDVDSQKWFDYADIAAGLPRLLYRLEGRRVRRLEAELPGLCDCICVVSEAETRCYRDFQPLANVTAIPNGVDGEYFHPNVGQTPTPNSCVFVALDYKPNIDAVQWFCQSVWPHVLMSHHAPSSQLWVADLAKTCVAYTDNRAWRGCGRGGCAALFVGRSGGRGSLRIARGVQNKVLEAMAAGRPVLATPQAFRTVRRRQNGRFVATTDIEWRDALRRLFADESIRECAGEAGRRYASQHARWDDALHGLARFLPTKRTPLGAPSQQRDDSGPCLTAEGELLRVSPAESAKNRGGLKCDRLSDAT